jgi:uncharacterized protein (TIRG00374 family)
MTNETRTTALPAFDSASDKVRESRPPRTTDGVEDLDDLNLDDEEFRALEEEVTKESLGRRFLEPRTVFSFLFAGVVLFFLARESDIDFAEVRSHLQDANPAYYVLGLGVFYGSFVVRALRWRGMLDRAGVNAEHGFDVPQIPGILQILLISWFANCVVPAKLGDAFRGFLLKERSKASFGLSMGTILAERLMDLVVLVLVLLASGFWVFGTHIPAKAELAFLLGAGTVAVGVIGVIVLWFARERVERLLPERMTSHFQKISTGIFHSLRRPAPIIGYTILIWVLDGVRLFIIAKALGIDLHVVEAQLVSLSSALVTIVPFTPGGLGLVEGFMVWILGQVDVANSPATALTFLDRSITYFSLIVVGVPLYLFYLRHKVVNVVSVVKAGK